MATIRVSHGRFPEITAGPRELALRHEFVILAADIMRNGFGPRKSRPPVAQTPTLPS